jgi:hypothetical protein
VVPLSVRRRPHRLVASSGGDVYATVVQRDALHHPGNPETTPCGKEPVADNIAGRHLDQPGAGDGGKRRSRARSYSAGSGRGWLLSCLGWLRSVGLILAG